MEHEITVHDFSDHLFWDVQRDALDLQEHKAQVIYKVVEFGTIDDWRLLKKLYTKDALKEVVLQLPSLDPVTVSFLASYLEVDKKAFRCYNKKGLANDFWK